MHKLPALATIHSISTILAALAISLYAKRPALLLMCACYVAGSEVLWRMSKSFMFYETAKYVITLICIIGILRIRKVRIPGSVLLYFALLLPAAVVTYYSFAFDAFRKSVLFNISGPLALTAAIAFNSNIEIRIIDFWKSAWSLALPLAGVAAITMGSTYWSDSIRFGNQSNFATSGGFGPNQVASSLALAALLLLMSVLLSRFQIRPRIGLLLIACLYLLQSMMTFSRGGAITTLLAFLIASPFFTWTRKQKRAAAGIFVALLVILPAAFFGLDRFTGGKLQKRFSQTKMTGRESLMRTDLQLWEDHPVFGVGLGMSKLAHVHHLAAHTEFTRAVAESGMFGALAYLILGAFCFRRSITIVRERLSPYRPALLSLLVWPWIYMIVNAARTAAPELVMGMAFVTLIPEFRSPGSMEPSNRMAV